MDSFSKELVAKLFSFVCGGGMVVGVLLLFPLNLTRLVKGLVGSFVSPEIIS